MSVKNTSDNEPEESEAKWDAYSDYALVSKWVTKSIRDAIEAYALLDQATQTGHKITSREETQLRADILAAAMRLRVELESERDRGQDYAKEILDRWEGEDGYIQEFRRVGFGGTQSLEWFDKFASDIRRAGWQLGYLKAGRSEEPERQGNSDDSEVYDMIEEMTR